VENSSFKEFKGISRNLNEFKGISKNLEDIKRT
jgi:hypothetical protein